MPALRSGRRPAARCGAAAHASRASACAASRAIRDVSSTFQRARFDMGERSLLEKRCFVKGLAGGRGAGRPQGTPGAPGAERDETGGEDETRGYVYGQEDEEEDALSRTTRNRARQDVIVLPISCCLHVPSSLVLATGMSVGAQPSSPHDPPFHLPPAPRLCRGPGRSCAGPFATCTLMAFLPIAVVVTDQRRGPGYTIAVVGGVVACSSVWDLGAVVNARRSQGVA